MGCWVGSRDGSHGWSHDGGPGVRAGPAGRPAAQELLDDRRARWGCHPDGMQHLLGRAVWDHDGVRDDLRAYLVEHLGDPEARALDAGVPAAWVTGDEVYGADPGLLAELETRGIG
jgi:hypothetical protein